MKIDSNKPLASNVGESTSRTPAARSNGNRPAAPDVASTSVSLGTTTAQLRSLESSVASASVVDSKKVAEIKQAISEGRFQVNAGAIADGLLKSVNDLIAASQR